MNDPFPEELLSAYLDGELPREERARVEEWLAASADHRRLFDDLQAIRRELQALPQQSLDTDFSNRVLAVIRERSGDASASPPAASGASPTDASGTTPSVPIKPASLPARHLGMPAWRWFAAGVAATLAAVIVGMNAAPEAMAEIGKLALVLPQEEAGEAEAPRKKDQPLAAPRNASPPQSEAKGATAEALPSDNAGGVEPRVEPSALATGASKDMRESSADKAEARKQAPGEGVPAESPAASVPSVAVKSATAPGAALESFDRNNGDGRGSTSGEGDKALELGFAERGSITADSIVELPVTGEQADRALAFYAQALDRQEHEAARHYNTVERLESLANVNEYAADKFVAQEEQETVVQRPAAGMALMKLLDAAAQGVQVAALEVTGTEAEVHALLDSLGVDGARNLRPERTLAGAGAGGMASFRATREGEEAVRGALPAGPEAKPAATASGKAVAKGDGAVEKPEATKEGERRNGAGGGSAGGGFPTVKMKMQSGFGGGDPLQDQVRRARDSQLEALDTTQPQLRVRLVIVPPQADPIGRTIELKPAE
jgi:hypothetical protein